MRRAGAAEWHLCMLPVRFTNLTISARVERLEDVASGLEAALGEPSEEL